MSSSVGVVIPTHNRSELLEITLRNVLGSIGVDLHVIVMDDASTDDTPSILASWADREPRMRFLRFDQSVGACRARNLGFRELDTEYVCFVDADDLVHPEKFARQVTVLTAQTELDGTVCQMAHFESNPNDATLLWNTFSGDTPRNRFLAHDPVWGMHAPLWRSASFRAWGGFDETLPMAQDYEFHARILAMGAKISLVAELLSFCRQHTGPSIGKSRQIARTRTLYRVFQKLQALAVEPGDQDRMGGDYLWLASLAAQQREREVLRDCLLQASSAGTMRPAARRRFGLFCRLAALSGKYRFVRMARDVATSQGLDLASREAWYMKHRISDEHGLLVLPMPSTSY